MKIGFSLGRCVRDIVNGDVSFDDVAFIITGTAIRAEEQMDNVILNYAYQRGYLEQFAANEEKLRECKDVAKRLMQTNKLIQPRLQGMPRHAQPENAVWVDMFPTTCSDNPAVKSAWDNYRLMIHMTENIDNESMDIFKQGT